MAVEQAQKIIDRAKGGERICSVERRHAVGFLMATEPEMTHQAIGDIFGVTEAQIRLDKKKVREFKAGLLKEDDIGLVIADIAINFDRQVRDLERSKKKCEEGTRTYAEHCKLIFHLELEKVKALQDLGYYPKNLGQISTVRFDFRANVSKDSSVDTRPVHLDTDKVQIQEAEFDDIPPANQLALLAPSAPAEEAQPVS